MDKSKSKRTFLEFFAGIGLVRWALEREGWRCIFANDIDPAKKRIYEDNFATDEYILKDVHSVSAREIPTAMLATACFPCTDLSLAGERKGLKGKQSGAFWGFTRILDEMGDRKPPLVLIENVTGFISSRRGKDFRAAVSELNRLGYRCDPLIIDAAHFVPQSRKRLFIVAARDDLGVMPPLSETLLYSESDLRPKLLTEFIDRNRELKWSLRSLVLPPVARTTIEGVLDDPPKTDPMWWSTKRVEHVLGQMKMEHLNQVQAMRGGRKFSYATVYRRMRDGRSMAEVRNDGISGCLRTPRGGSSRQILIQAGLGKINVRYMTAREYARLQGVDDSYQINVPLSRGLFGFGDAVCVPVIRWIAANYLHQLAEGVARLRTASGIGTHEVGLSRSPARPSRKRSFPAVPTLS